MWEETGYQFDACRIINRPSTGLGELSLSISFR